MSLFREINFKAVLIGIGAEIVCTIVASICIGAILAESGFSADEADTLVKANWLLAINLVVGLMLLFASTLFALRFTRRPKILNGGVIGGACLLLALPFLIKFPAWYGLTVFVLAVPCGMLAGRISQKNAPQRKIRFEGPVSGQ